MSLHFESRQIGEVRVEGLDAMRGLGVIVLRFGLHWSIHPLRDAPTVSVFGTFARVSVMIEGLPQPVFIGHAFPEVAWSDEMRPGAPVTRPCLYLLSVADAQLAALESLRQGRDLSFTLEVFGHASQGPIVRQINDTLRRPVPVSEWLRLVTHTGVADTLLVAVAVPIVPQKSRYAAAARLARNAHQCLREGDYGSAVAECRRAIESALKAGRLVDSAREARRALASGPEQRQMDKHARLLALVEALKNFAHPAHHVGEHGEPDIFSRNDAVIAVASTCAVIASLAGDRSR